MFNIKKIKENIIKISKDSEGFKPDIFEKTHSFWVKEGVAVTLDHENIEILKESVDEIRADEYIKKNFPEKYIEEKLEEIITEAVKTPKEIREKIIHGKLENFRDELKKEIKDWIFLVPIKNLNISDQFDIGNVKLLRFEDISEELFRSYRFPPDFEKGIKKDFFEKNHGKVFAKVKVSGVVSYSHILALHQIRLALSILMLYKSRNELPIGLEGEVPDSVIRNIFICTGKKQGHRLSRERIGLPNRMELNSKKREFLNENKFDEFNKVLKKIKPSEFERRLLTAIFWFSEALNIEIKDDKKRIYEKNKKKHQNLEYFKLGERFIKLFTALESILVFSKYEAITENIAERTAMLLGNDYENRKYLKKLLKEYYDTRSKIVHEGDSFVTKYELNNLTEIVRELIFVLVDLKEEHSLNTGNDLKVYIDKMKFGGFSN